ncbi:MAG: hypothetical protein Q9212_004052 [Teloschistes hypoglaucus]
MSAAAETLMTPKEEEEEEEEPDTTNSAGETTTTPILDLPTENDGFSILATKILALAQVVKTGQSIAIRTGYRATTMAGKDPEAVALEGMKELERMMYQAWKKGCRLEPYDFNPRPGGAVVEPTTAKMAKEYQDRAAALSIMYGIPGTITAAQAMMWTRSESPYIPCMKAIMRVERQKVAMTGGIPNLTSLEVGDLQTLKKILAVTAATVQKGRMEIKKGFSRHHHHTTPKDPRIKTLQRNIARATQSIADDSQILQTRLRELREKKSGGQQ